MFACCRSVFLPLCDGLRLQAAPCDMRQATTCVTGRGCQPLLPCLAACACSPRAAFDGAVAFYCRRHYIQELKVAAVLLQKKSVRLQENLSAIWQSLLYFIHGIHIHIF